MGEVKEPKPVKLFLGLLIAKLPLLPQIYEALEKELGPIELSSELIDFTYTNYYEPEMGARLKRQFLSFRKLIAPDRLPEIKLFTNELERNFAEEGRRRVNLDPGYLTGANLVLATTKNFSHRLYLGKGIYGEVTLIFKGGKFEPLPWTYPDYRSNLELFHEIRKKYLAQLREEG